MPSVFLRLVLHCSVFKPEPDIPSPYSSSWFLLLQIPLLLGEPYGAQRCKPLVFSNESFKQNTTYPRALDA